MPDKNVNEVSSDGPIAADDGVIVLRRGNGTRVLVFVSRIVYVSERPGGCDVYLDEDGYMISTIDSLDMIMVLIKQSRRGESYLRVGLDSLRWKSDNQA